MQAKSIPVFIYPYRQDAQAGLRQMPDEATHARRRRPQPLAGKVLAFGGDANNRALAAPGHFQYAAHCLRPGLRILGARRHGRHAGKTIHARHAAEHPACHRCKQTRTQWIGISPGLGNDPLYFHIQHAAYPQCQPPGTKTGPCIMVDGHQIRPGFRDVFNSIDLHGRIEQPHTGKCILTKRTVFASQRC